MDGRYTTSYDMRVIQDNFEMCSPENKNTGDQKDPNRRDSIIDQRDTDYVLAPRAKIRDWIDATLANRLASRQDLIYDYGFAAVFARLGRFQGEKSMRKFSIEDLTERMNRYSSFP